ncbi:MAG: hypothetical protein COB02_12515 [Candidatus Cloacimonadota bacterium]|nr:MAG: hypothetical protein COB02_12515 [Candidatus Cloacimonadota bacterium]
MKNISILIPYFKKEDSISEVLLSIDKHSNTFHEVILLCDGCKSPKLPSFKIIKPKIVYNIKNKGLSYSRNKLLQKASNNYILFLDADAVIYPDFFKVLDEALNKEDIIAGQEFSSPSNGFTNQFRSLFWKQSHGQNNLSNAPFLMGICFAGKKKSFLKIGGFNQSFGNFGEDIEFSLRYKKNEKIYYSYELKVHHLRNDNITSMLKMINNHNKHFIKAHFFHKIEPQSYLSFSFLWIFISAFSSFLKHKSLKLSLACLFFNGFSAINRCYYCITYPSSYYDKY